MNDRELLRTTFDTVAEFYDAARPDYPDELFDTLITAAHLVPDSRLLEIGSASGKATVPLARRGYRITCVELGPRLAAEARRNLAGYPAVEVIEGDFGTCRVEWPHTFDLVFAATAWHWLDPVTKYARAAEFLRRGGFLAWWSATHVFPADGDPFFADLQEIYDEIGEGIPGDSNRPRPGELRDESPEAERSGLFSPALTRQFDWAVDYSADDYLRLLDTFSGHIRLQEWQRDRLYGEIRRRLARRPSGTVRRHWGAVLQVARLRD